MNARNAALKTLVRISDEQAFSNLEVNKSIKNSKVDPKDKNLYITLVYGTLQHLITIDYIISKFLNRKISTLETKILWILRLAVYQILFLDNIKEYAIVNEAVNQSKKINKHSSKFVNAVLRNIIRQKAELLEDIHNNEDLTIKYSIPQWILDEYKNTFKEDFYKVLERIDDIPELMIRVRPENFDQVFSELDKMNAKPRKITDPLLGNILIIIDNPKVFENGIQDLDLYKNGLFTIQDKGAMLIGLALNPKENDLVLDLCAAPGGKTTHIAEIMNDKGNIIACDLYLNRLALIRNTADRLKLNNIRTTIQDGTEFNPKFVGKFDKILVDAPCSGLGIIRRKPDIRYNTKKEDLEELNKIQVKILTNAVKYLKKDGLLVYSTCTVSQKENQDVINTILSEYPNELELLEEQQLSFLDDSDCFYFAVLKKK